MGKRGPAKKPAVLKILNGNPGNYPIQKEVRPMPIAPECPIWLSPFAQEEWNRVYLQLERLGLLTEIDGTSFEAYCVAYAQWKESNLILREKGLTFVTPNGYEQQRPEVSIANNAVKIMRAFISDFGMSPAARARMSVSPEGGAADDEEEEFFKLPKAK